MNHPVLFVYSAFLNHHVRFLLMGGQACIFYGVSEFTRDSDFCVFCDKNNLVNLTDALAELKAENTFFPPLKEDYLLQGHACHFLCGIDAAAGFRVDVMAKMRNCPEFDEMWDSRKIHSIEGLDIPVIGLRHLVAAKKTQRDKDWPVVRRLIEEDFRKNPEDPAKTDWWLMESRTPGMLIDLAQRFPEPVRALAQKRPLLLHAREQNTNGLEEALLREELEERRKDRAYWEPLKRELERMRHERKN